MRTSPPPGRMHVPPLPPHLPGLAHAEGDKGLAPPALHRKGGAIGDEAQWPEGMKQGAACLCTHGGVRASGIHRSVEEAVRRREARALGHARPPTSATENARSMPSRTVQHPSCTPAKWPAPDRRASGQSPRTHGCASARRPAAASAPHAPRPASSQQASSSSTGTGSGGRAAAEAGAATCGGGGGASRRRGGSSSSSSSGGVQRHVVRYCIHWAVQDCVRQARGVAVQSQLAAWARDVQGHGRGAVERGAGGVGGREGGGRVRVQQQHLPMLQHAPPQSNCRHLPRHHPRS